MKRFAAQYIITNSGPPLKRAVITSEDDGTIVSVKDGKGSLSETHSTEFHNGVIVPGFVNCHCHLELSRLKDHIKQKKGLGSFIEEIRNSAGYNYENSLSSILSADRLMYNEGTVLCADICNTSDTLKVKKESKIKYLNLLEVFGLDPEKAKKRFNEINKVALLARELSLPYSLVPHSAYSMSLPLLRLLRNESLNNKVTSIHFMESAEEADFLQDRSGSLMSSYERSGLLPLNLKTVTFHADAILNELTPSGNLILVHNTYADKNIIRKLKERKNLFWCLCPNSNIFIENKIPPLELLLEEGCEIVIGTDSFASNTNLSILSELKTLQYSFPDIKVEDLIFWATLNGAKALGEEDNFGKIETGKKPGLLLIQNIDLQKMKLLPESYVTRLI